jgi:chaperonin GroES
MSQSTNKTSKTKITEVNLLPLFDRVVVKPYDKDEEKVNSFGIIIPDTISKEKPEQGIIVAVGEGKFEDGKRVPPTVKKGDRVVFSRYGYDEVKIDDVDYYILKEENILAIIK